MFWGNCALPCCIARTFARSQTFRAENFTGHFYPNRDLSGECLRNRLCRSETASSEHKNGPLERFDPAAACLPAVNSLCQERRGCTMWQPKV